jgi:hypothetical protein
MMGLGGEPLNWAVRQRESGGEPLNCGDEQQESVTAARGINMFHGTIPLESQMIFVDV